MRQRSAFVSPAYPVLHSVAGPRPASAPGEGHAALSLGLLVGGIPSFLATIPVAESELAEMTRSLEKGDVRVAVVGISVDGSEFEEGALADAEPDIAGIDSRPGELPGSGATRLPAALLSLVCSDNRQIRVARIVAREGSAAPDDVARFVLGQIARGVQIPDLASAS